MSHPTINPPLSRYTIASGEEGPARDSPMMSAYKDPFGYVESLSPAEAAFAFQGSASHNKQAYNDLVGHRDSRQQRAPDNNDRRPVIPRSASFETRSVAQMYEDRAQRRLRPLPTLRERVKTESPILAHVRTNVIVCLHQRRIVCIAG